MLSPSPLCSLLPLYALYPLCALFFPYMISSSSLCSLLPLYVLFFPSMLSSSFLCALLPLYTLFFLSMRSSSSLHSLLPLYALFFLSTLSSSSLCSLLLLYVLFFLSMRSSFSMLSSPSLHLEIDREGRVRTKLYDKGDDFNFPIVNIPFICSNIPAAPAYGVFISQLIRYSRACGSYQDFLDRGLLLTRKLLNQGFLLVKSSLRKFYGRHHELVDRYGISQNDHGYVPLVVNTSRSFLVHELSPGFVTRLRRRVSLVEQELHTLPEHLSSPPVFSGVRVTRSLV